VFRAHFSQQAKSRTAIGLTAWFASKLKIKLCSTLKLAIGTSINTEI